MTYVHPTGVGFPAEQTPRRVNKGLRILLSVIAAVLAFAGARLLTGQLLDSDDEKVTEAGTDVSTGTIADNRFEGDVYRSDEGRFSVSFPATPSRGTNTEQMGGLTVESTSFDIEKDGFYYAVQYLDLPEDVPLNLDYELDGLVNNGAVTSRVVTEVSGYEALKGTIVDADGHWSILIVRAPEREYLVLAAGESESPPDADEFLSSFDVLAG